jgi:DNA topoisomerase-1
MGPYGPYLQVGVAAKEDKKKPKRVSIPPEISISDLNEALAKKLLSLPLDMGLHPDTNKKIVANIGRFGPYVNHDGKFKSIPKSENIFELTHERAVELINEAIAKNAPLRILGEDAEKNQSVEIFNGRYGPYIQRGSTKAPIAKSIDIEEISLEMALEMIKNKETKTKNGKKKTVKTKKAA